MGKKLDFYEILGIPRTATHAEIRRAFRKLARQLHPDVNPSPDATQRMQELNQAYTALRDTLSRAQYNRGTYDPAAASKRPYQRPTYATHTPREQEYTRRTYQSTYRSSRTWQGRVATVTVYDMSMRWVFVLFGIFVLLQVITLGFFFNYPTFATGWPYDLNVCACFWISSFIFPMLGMVALSQSVSARFDLSGLPSFSDNAIVYIVLPITFIYVPCVFPTLIRMATLPVQQLRPYDFMGAVTFVAYMVSVVIAISKLIKWSRSRRKTRPRQTDIVER